jgi:hypothetical protein
MLLLKRREEKASGTQGAEWGLRTGIAAEAIVPMARYVDHHSRSIRELRRELAPTSIGCLVVGSGKWNLLLELKRMWVMTGEGGQSRSCLVQRW